MLIKKIGPTGANVRGLDSRSLAVVIPVHCEKARTKGPCNHCGFFKKSSDALAPDEVLRDFRNILEDPRNTPPFTTRIELLSYGSLLQDDFPLQVLLDVLHMVSEKKYLEVVVETRPEHVTSKKLSELKRAVGDVFVRIAFGLESWNDYVRNGLLNKGISQDEVLRVLGLLCSFNFGAWLYTFLKPLGLSEKESVLDCVATVRNCSLAFPDLDTVFALQPAFIAKGSVFSRSAFEKNYLPPFLWSIIEFLKIVHSEEFLKTIGKTVAPQIFIGLSDEQLAFGNYVKNCPECSDRIYRLLDEDYNRTQNAGIFDAVDCACKQVWGEIYAGRKQETYANSVSSWDLSSLSKPPCSD